VDGQAACPVWRTKGIPSEQREPPGSTSRRVRYPRAGRAGAEATRKGARGRGSEYGTIRG